MEDYIDALLLYVREQRLTAISCDYSARLAREEDAFTALSGTFTEEQRKLFHAYDAARSACGGCSEDAYARAVFLLAKEIYR